MRVREKSFITVRSRKRARPLGNVRTFSCLCWITGLSTALIGASAQAALFSPSNTNSPVTSATQAQGATTPPRPAVRKLIPGTWEADIPDQSGSPIYHESLELDNVQPSLSTRAWANSQFSVDGKRLIGNCDGYWWTTITKTASSPSHIELHIKGANDEGGALCGRVMIIRSVSQETMVVDYGANWPDPRQPIITYRRNSRGPTNSQQKP